MNFLYFPFLASICGLFVGSFANVVILRLWSGQKGICTGRSECPKCKHVLGVSDLVPVFSWLFLRGKCRYCHKKISIQYPLVELSMGVLWGFLTWIQSVSFPSPSAEWMQFFFSLIVFSTLLIVTVYDLKYMEIPDEISLPLLIFLIFSLPLSFTPSWQSAVWGAMIPVGFFGLLFLISKGAWIGLGDLRLGAIMGFLLGWQNTLVALFLAYFLGAAVGIILIVLQRKKGKSMIPFGPFLVLGTFVAYFWGEGIWRWYGGFLGI